MGCFAFAFCIVLQTVKAAVWFTSFDFVQAYLQLTMLESDIHKTAFRAGLSGLYEFTCMPVSLSSNVVSVISWRCALVISNM